MKPATASRGLLRLIWPLLAAIALLLVLATAGIALQSAVRAYIGGEAYWSRAQKQAVIHLIRYAEAGLDEDLKGFRRSMAVVLGDRDARIALASSPPDHAAARRGLLAGGNHPDDVGRMVVAFPLIRLDGGVRRALQAWEKADGLLAELNALGAVLREEVRARGADTWRAQAYARSATELDMKLTPLAEEYTRALGAAARRLNLLLGAAGAVLALALAAWAVFMTRRTLMQLQGAEAQQREAERRLADLAQYDALTGLANRTLFHDRLGQAIARAHRTEQPVALLFLDLDRFKEINDSLGHEAGDRVLQESAARLRAHLREGDSIARLGGDEFTVVLEDLAGADEVRAVAQKLVTAFAEPFRAGGQDLYVTLSLGVALYPRDGDDADTLVRHADTAMYEAKSEGRDGFQFYAPVMSAAASERLTVEGRLRQALERNEFLLHYQPVVRIESGEIASVEALLRWRHPEDGLVAPARFIAVAEQTGLIVPIGDWVLREACAQARRWQDAGLRPLRVAVNLSARQFRKGRLVPVVREALEAAGLDARWLMLEITETLLMDNPLASGATLQQLRKMGVHMALDDFGTGYSSLAYLKHFPIDLIKIDRSFVSDITADSDDASIVKATIGLATSLGMQTTAEGVDSAEQLAFLREHGCRFGQGFLFSPPVPAQGLEAMLRADRRFAVG